MSHGPAPVPTCGALMRGGANDGHICDLPMGHNGGVHEPVQTDAERALKYASILPLTDVPEICGSCGELICVQCFKGTGVCSTNCEKFRNGETPVEEARVSAS